VSPFKKKTAGVLGGAQPIHHHAHLNLRLAARLRARRLNARQHHYQNIGFNSNIKRGCIDASNQSRKNSSPFLSSVISLPLRKSSPFFRCRI
jgi:hypothetical protein